MIYTGAVSENREREPLNIQFFPSKGSSAKYIIGAITENESRHRVLGLETAQVTPDLGKITVYLGLLNTDESLAATFFSFTVEPTNLGWRVGEKILQAGDKYQDEQTNLVYSINKREEDTQA